jgi:hypothetical protein
MIKSVFIGLLVLIVALAVFIQMRPDNFRVTRSATFAAPPDLIFPEVNNLHNWEAWSPWARLDPQGKQTYSGPPEGVGASFSWSGNMRVGAGTMTITESKPNEFVKLRLDFVKPMAATNTAEFTFKPENGQTVVTWTMYGPCNFVRKAMGLFIDCDKMIGAFFEKGLADMKKISETGAQKGTASATVRISSTDS